MQCAENLEAIISKQTALLGICDMVNMMLKSPNKDKHELHIIEGKAFVNSELVRMEMNAKQYEELNDITCSRFTNEVIDRIMEATHEWRV
jgi:hypothetical protein